jgi:hypothetical protein
MTTKYALLINIICYRTNEFKTLKLTLDSLDECKNKIILIFKNELEKYNFDFELNFEDYLLLLNHHYIPIQNLNLIDYNILTNNQWIEQPWTIQEIYEIVIDLINKLDIQKSILDKYENNDTEYDEITI